MKNNQNGKQKMNADLESYIKAKQNLEAAKADLDSAEKRLLEVVPHKESGSITTEIEGYKITTTGRVDTKLDQTKIVEIQDKIPAPLLNRLLRIKTTTEINARELQFIQNNEPQYYAFLAQAIERKPAKTTIKVEPV